MSAAFSVFKPSVQNVHQLQQHTIDELLRQIVQYRQQGSLQFGNVETGTTRSVVNTRELLDPGLQSPWSVPAVWRRTDTSLCSFRLTMQQTSVNWRSTLVVSTLTGTVSFHSVHSKRYKWQCSICKVLVPKQQIRKWNRLYMFYDFQLYALLQWKCSSDEIKKFLQDASFDKILDHKCKITTRRKSTTVTAGKQPVNNEKRKWA